MDTTVWFNPACSTCRTAQAVLVDHGIDADYVRYLEQAPTRAELERVLGLLGTDDPRAIVREKEAVYGELGLATADRDALLEAMVAHPILIQRPIVVRGDRAVVARPAERVSDLLDQEERHNAVLVDDEERHNAVLVDEQGRVDAGSPPAPAG